MFIDKYSNTIYYYYFSEFFKEFKCLNFSVNLDQCNASLLNKQSIPFLILLTPSFWTVKYTQEIDYNWPQQSALSDRGDSQCVFNLSNIWLRIGSCMLRHRADPRLLGVLRKTVLTGGGFEWLWMKCIFPLFTLSRIALAERARETVSLPFSGSFCFQLVFFCLEQETLRHSRYMIWLIFM